MHHRDPSNPFSERWLQDPAHAGSRGYRRQGSGCGFRGAADRRSPATPGKATAFAYDGLGRRAPRSATRRPAAEWRSPPLTSGAATSPIRCAMSPTSRSEPTIARVTSIGDMIMNYKGKLAYIRKILPMEWNPIGVSGVDQATSEYDSYAQALISIISKNCSEDDIFNYLGDIERELGIHGDKAKRKSTAKTGGVNLLSYLVSSRGQTAEQAPMPNENRAPTSVKSAAVLQSPHPLTRRRAAVRPGRAGAASARLAPTP